LNAGNVAELKRAWSAPLGAAVDGQPLYASNVQTLGGARNLYLAATEAGSVFALDARNGKVVWRVTLGSVHLGCAQLPGGTYGATGGMTYDASHQTLYAASSNQLWALDVRTGKSEAGWPITLPFDPNQLHVWGPFRNSTPACTCRPRPTATTRRTKVA
jgi:outer membrane protein assembly factor BamB